MKPAKVVLISILFLIGLLFLVRAALPAEVDDVHPDISCEQWIIAESDILWVVPNWNNESVGDMNNVEWCEAMNKMNKTFGLHGVRHTYQEFAHERDNAYLGEGIESFEQCFGRRPGAFKAPQLAMSEQNRELVEKNGMEYHGKIGQVLHKVYHCGDTGEFPNWAIRIF